MTSWFEGETKNAVPPGSVVAVAQDGKLAYLQAIGFPDRDKNTPMRPDSIFRIASMSKPVTSVAAMMLVDDGKLELDAPVAQDIPEIGDMQVVKTDPATGIEPICGGFEPAKRAMTVRDLLRHTSGLIYGRSGPTPTPRFGNPGIHMLYGSRTPYRRDKPMAYFVPRASANCRCCISPAKSRNMP